MQSKRQSTLLLVICYFISGVVGRTKVGVAQILLLRVGFILFVIFVVTVTRTFALNVFIFPRFVSLCFYRRR